MKILNVDPLQFIKVTTPEAAYILGFLWADGYLGSNYSINSEIVADDAIIIEKIFLSTGKWGIYHRTRKNYRPQIKFSCTSKILHTYLNELGFNNNNKCPNKLLKTIPKKIKHYWFRGYFDGDGCWYFYPKDYLRQCVISSKYNQNWKFMIQLMKELKIQKYHINQIKSINKKGIQNKHSRIRLCNLDAIKKFGDYIYSDDQFGLERKLNKFIDMTA